MKRILISTIAIAAALASCSKSEGGGTELPDNAREIRLSAGVPLATVTPGSKTPIASGGTFTAAVVGWESGATVSYSDAATWTATTNITANETAQNVTLSEKQVYNSDSNIKTYIRAWYPEGTLTNGVVSFANADGQTDAMLVEAAVVGSATDQTNKTLAFTHPTTQLKFVVKGESSLASGTKLQSITVKSIQLPNGFDLTSATASVKYAVAADLLVPGLGTAVTIPIKTGADDVVPAVAGSAVMINPPTGNQITLDIVTSTTTYTDITATIDVDPNFVAGKAYTITMTFSQSDDPSNTSLDVSLGATVDNWTSNTGSGNIN